MSFDKTFDSSDAHLMPADAAACVAFLRSYQEWRRWIGAAPLAEEGPAMPHPKSIGLAIDMAIRLIEERGELLAMLERASDLIGSFVSQEELEAAMKPIDAAIASAKGGVF